MICNLYMNLMPINALWSMSSCMLCLHMFVKHVVLVEFVVIVVISLTLWMLRYRCGYTWKCLITSLSTTQFEYRVKFSMEIQIFRKIMEFMLTLAIISPLFYARGRASFKHVGGVITSPLMLCKYYVAKVLRSKRKNEKKLWWEEKKSKEKRKNK
jgi:hypothetical protein